MIWCLDIALIFILKNIYLGNNESKFKDMPIAIICVCYMG